MTTMEKIYDIIRKLNKKDIAHVPLKPETQFVDDLGLDSLDIAELLVMIEDSFSIEVPMEDAKKLATIAMSAEYVDRRLAG